MSVLSEGSRDAEASWVAEGPAEVVMKNKRGDTDVGIQCS